LAVAVPKILHLEISDITAGTLKYIPAAAKIIGWGNFRVFQLRGYGGANLRGYGGVNDGSFLNNSPFMPVALAVFGGRKPPALN
jgi:hypothetical protein